MKQSFSNSKRDAFSWLFAVIILKTKILFLYRSTKEHKSRLHLLTSSISSFPVSPRLPTSLSAHLLFSSFLPSCCWSLVTSPPVPTRLGLPFPFVGLSFPCRAHSWFSLALLVQECGREELESMLGVEPGILCPLSTCYTTRSHHQSQ